jgi:hypothetical protein
MCGLRLVPNRCGAVAVNSMEARGWVEDDPPDADAAVSSVWNVGASFGFGGNTLLLNDSTREPSGRA